MIPGGFYLNQHSNWSQRLALPPELVANKLLDFLHILQSLVWLRSCLRTKQETQIVLYLECNYGRYADKIYHNENCHWHYFNYLFITDDENHKQKKTQCFSYLKTTHKVPLSFIKSCQPIWKWCPIHKNMFKTFNSHRKILRNISNCAVSTVPADGLAPLLCSLFK